MELTEATIGLIVAASGAGGAGGVWVANKVHIEYLNRLVQALTKRIERLESLFFTHDDRKLP